MFLYWGLFVGSVQAVCRPSAGDSRTVWRLFSRVHVVPTFSVFTHLFSWLFLIFKVVFDFVVCDIQSNNLSFLKKQTRFLCKKQETGGCIQTLDSAFDRWKSGFAAAI